MTNNIKGPRQIHDEVRVRAGKATIIAATGNVDIGKARQKDKKGFIEYVRLGIT